CAWPRLAWSSVYGTLVGEDGSDDAFAGVMKILKNRLAGGPPLDGRLESACPGSSAPKVHISSLLCRTASCTDPPGNKRPPSTSTK
ncbi:hypothetical protein CYMTET_15312, partial [Cymbomonas tetramitiformis]